MKKSVSHPPRLPLVALGGLFVLLIAPSDRVLAQERDSSTAPRIIIFRVLPATIEGEQWHEFHWEVTNTDKVTMIKDGVEMPGRTQLPDGSVGWPLSMSGSLRMKLKKLTAFELVAADQAGQSTRTMFTVKGPFSTPQSKPPAQTLEDSTAPKIHSFRVSPAMSEPGGSIRFFWQVEGEGLIRLYEGDHEIDLSGMATRKVGEVGALSTTIDETTTFRLEAIGPSRQAASKTFTVHVSGATEPGGSCAIWGQLKGKWRQEVRETPTGPISTWTVGVNGYTAGSDRPVAGGSVDSRGKYRFDDLESGENYIIRPSWRSSPAQGTISCSSGETRQGPTFRISGGPVID